MDNGISIHMCEWPSYDTVEEGMVHGLLRYEVWKGTDLNDDEDSPYMALMYEIGVDKLKVPIKGEYIPTPMFPIVC
jgi:hypothetical protein